MNNLGLCNKITSRIDKTIKDMAREYDRHVSVIVGDIDFIQRYIIFVVIPLILLLFVVISYYIYNLQQTEALIRV